MSEEWDIVDVSLVFGAAMTDDMVMSLFQEMKTEYKDNRLEVVFEKGRFSVKFSVPDYLLAACFHCVYENYYGAPLKRIRQK